MAVGLHLSKCSPAVVSFASAASPLQLLCAVGTAAKPLVSIELCRAVVCSLVEGMLAERGWSMGWAQHSRSSQRSMLAWFR